MLDREKPAKLAFPIRLRRYLWFLAVFWTIAIGLVLTWELWDERNHAFELAHSEASGIWKKEYSVYRWAVGQGLIYVPVEGETQPDPNLAETPDRDITTTTGRRLTLISPPAIMRQVFTSNRGQTAVTSHITSLTPKRSQNAPDAWEKQALESFAAGQPEACDEVTIQGKSYLRLMRPLHTEASFSAHHNEAGHKGDDLLEGLSVSMPMASVWSTQGENIRRRLAGYGGMWLLGLAGLVLLSRNLTHQIRRRNEAEQKLQEAHDLLEQRVTERTAELAESNDQLANEIAERAKTERWLLESEQRFRGYFEQGLVGMAILSPQQEWVEVNLRLCRMLGYSEEELLLVDWRTLTHPEDRAAVETELDRVLRGDSRGFVLDVRLTRKDGRTFQAGVSVQRQQNADGALDSLLVLIQDMTHRKTA